MVGQENTTHSKFVRVNMYRFLVSLDRLLNPKRMAYAWITGSALWLAWLLSISLGPGNMDLADQVIGTDYLQFHAAGLTVRLGDSSQLYDFDYQSELEIQVAGPELVNFHAFITPPFFAYLFVPLSFLPYPLSFAIWSTFGIICLYLSLRLLRTHHPLEAFLVSLTFFPVFATISFGQNSLLSLFLFALAYACWRKRLPFLSGLIASLLLYKPQLVLGISLLWLLELRRDWKALLGLAVGGMGLVTLCILTMPEASLAYLEFSRTSLSSMLSWEQFPIWHAHTWRAFWYLLFPGHLSLAEVLSLIVSFIGVVAFGFLWKKHRADKDILYAMAICLTLWVSPHAMIYDWAILIIPALILWQNVPTLRPIRKSLYALVWIALFLSGPLTVGQLKIIPIAIQVSLPVYALVMAIIFLSLMKVQESSDTLPQELQGIDFPSRQLTSE